MILLGNGLGPFKTKTREDDITLKVDETQAVTDFIDFLDQALSSKVSILTTHKESQTKGTYIDIKKFLLATFVFVVDFILGTILIIDMNLVVGVNSDIIRNDKWKLLTFILFFVTFSGRLFQRRLTWLIVDFDLRSIKVSIDFVIAKETRLVILEAR